MDSFEKASKEKALAAQRLFSTPDGKLVLEALERQFVLGSIRASSVEDTYFNLGARDVVIRLRRLATAAMEEKST